MSASSTIAGLGARTDFVATVMSVDSARLGLSPEEATVLSLVGRGSRIDEVIVRSRLGEARAIAVLIALRSKGAIQVLAPDQIAGSRSEDAALNEEVDLEPERRREILELDKKLERGVDHFTALGVLPGTGATDVKKAYYEASRRFHPDRFYGKNLGSFRARIDRIFRRLTEAHSVLTNPDQRAAYLKAHPHLAITPSYGSGEASAEPLSPESAERRAERQARLARHPYLSRTHRFSELLARGRAAIAKGEYERAYADLYQASQLEPKNREVVPLLAEARKRHEVQRAQRELDRGEELEKQGDFKGAQAAYRLVLTLDAQNVEALYRLARVGRAMGQDVLEVRGMAMRAVELADKAPYHLLLAQVYVQMDNRNQARHHLKEVLRLEPDNAEARALLKKLGFSLLDILKR